MEPKNAVKRYPDKATGPTPSKTERDFNEGGRKTVKKVLPLPIVTAPKEDIDAALKSLRICFFHAGGLDCPYQKMCSYSHRNEDILYGYDKATMDTDKGRPTEKFLMDMIIPYYQFLDDDQTKAATSV